jgi:hypothetical protein
MQFTGRTPLAALLDRLGERDLGASCLDRTPLVFDTSVDQTNGT